LPYSKAFVFDGGADGLETRTRLVERILSHRSPKARTTVGMLGQRFVVASEAPAAAKPRMAVPPRDWIASTTNAYLWRPEPLIFTSAAPFTVLQ
jgi:hypothetical protein